MSRNSSNSCISRTTNGRFEGKYKIGDKTVAGNLIKEVNKDDWEFVRKDNKGNSYYKCKKKGCNKASVRKDARRIHSCKYS